MRPNTENISRKPGADEVDFYADTMEQDTLIKSFGDINQHSGIFGNKFADGLNREKSIFDKKAIFITERGK